MPRLLVELVALVSLAVAASALYSRDSPVVSLTAETFANLVIPTPKPWLVEFYAPWCGHCKSFAPEYAKAAENLKNVVNVGAVDCDAEKNKPLCGNFGIQGFPTVKLFKSEPEIKALESGQQGMSKTPIDYQGPRTAGAVAKWALNFLPDKVRSLTSKNIEEFEKLPNSKAILFSEKAAHSNLLKALSLDFDEEAAMMYPARSFIPIGQISSGEKEIVKKYGVTNFPALVVVKADGSTEQFSEDFKYDALHRFLKSHSNELKQDSRQGGAPPSPPEPATSAKLYHAFDQSSFDEACKPSGLCLVFFLDPSSDEHEKYLSILESLVQKYKSFRFVWIDGVEHETLKSQFYVADILPQALALQRKSLRVRYYKSGFEEELLEEFLDSVKAGKGRTASLDADPTWPAPTSDEL